MQPKSYWDTKRGPLPFGYRMRLVCISVVGCCIMKNPAPKNAPGKSCVRDGHFGSYPFLILCRSQALSMLGLSALNGDQVGCVSASGVQRSARPTFFGEKCACFQSVESCGGADPFACWGCQRRIAANIALPSPQGALDKNTIKLLTDTFRL